MSETANPDPVAVRDQKERCRLHLRAHLSACCRELLTWRRGKLLPEGRMREAAAMLQFAGDDSLAMTEGMLYTEAITLLAHAIDISTPA